MKLMALVVLMVLMMALKQDESGDPALPPFIQFFFFVRSNEISRQLTIEFGRWPRQFRESLS